MDEKERQYREYLALREQNKKKTEGRDYKVDTTYGEYFTSNVKHEEARIRQEKATHAREVNSRQASEKDEYLRARGMGHNQKKQIARNASYNRNDRADAKAMKRSHRPQHGSHGKGGKGRKIRRIVIIVLLAIVILGGAAILGVMGILGSVKQVDVDKNNIGINPDVASQLDGYRNIAILGTDARAGEDDSEVRSDAIIVASINEETNEVKMFSVYRDTLLYIGDEGYDKITHAY
ncbi:MAG: hypothetical protein Q4B78_01760, partial [Bacillota bacterium]|nr:hypothetical protein [Bacillota bacterium]